MTTGTLHHRIMTLVTASAAVTLAVSTVPSSAPAATVPIIATTVRQHAQVGQSFRISTKLIKGGHDVVIGDAICLANDKTFCTAVGNSINGRPKVDDIWAIIGDAIGLLGDIIAIWAVKRSGNSEKEDKDGTADGGNQEGNGDCLVAPGAGQDVELASCNTAHGAYWQDQAVPGGYRIWNTAYHGFLTAHDNQSGTRLYIWHTPMTG